MRRKGTLILQGVIAAGALSLLLTSLSLAHDRDNNPPGPLGGPGTNWENPPGPRGGPGTSPNRRRWNGNPPGPAGGPGAGPRWHKGG